MNYMPISLHNFKSLFWFKKYIYLCTGSRSNLVTGTELRLSHFFSNQYRVINIFTSYWPNPIMLKTKWVIKSNLYKSKPIMKDNVGPIYIVYIYGRRRYPFTFYYSSVSSDRCIAENGNF